MVKLNASTIVETVVAMIIGLIVFLLAASFLIDLQRTGLSEKKIKAMESLNNYANQLEIEPAQVPSVFSQQYNEFIVQTEISAYKDGKNLALVALRIFDKGQTKITEQKRILPFKIP